MRTILILFLLVLASAVAPSCTDRLDDTALTEQSASVHWLKAAGDVTPSGALEIAFKLAGLGANETLAVTAAGAASAEYGCMTKSGSFPNAANKAAVAGPILASGEYTSGKNGSIVGVLIVEPPAAPLFCPPGQSETLLAAAYDGVTLTAPGAGTIAVTGGPFTYAR